MSAPERAAILPVDDSNSIRAPPSYGASGHSAEPGELKITGPEE